MPDNQLNYIKEVVVSPYIYDRILKGQIVHSSQLKRLQIGEEYRIVEKGNGAFVKRQLHTFIDKYAYWS